MSASLPPRLGSLMIRTQLLEEEGADGKGDGEIGDVATMSDVDLFASSSSPTDAEPSDDPLGGVSVVSTSGSGTAAVAAAAAEAEAEYSSLALSAAATAKGDDTRPSLAQLLELEVARLRLGLSVGLVTS
jgi:hypothetical protein